MTAPHSLRADYKDHLREAIAAAYAATGDLGRARVRLQLLGDADAIQALTAQAQRALASGLPFETAHELARLASDLQAGISSIPSRTPRPVTTLAAATTVTAATRKDPTPSALPFTASPGASPTSQATPFPTPTTVASPTPVPSPSVPFRLASQDKVCDPAVEGGLLQVTVLDARGHPLPGIEITVTWNQGADRFFTGLQPEISPGYADYAMTGGTTYSLQVARLGIPVSGLTPPICTSANNQPYIGGLRLTFAAP